MHRLDDLEARLRRDADTVRRAAQPGATLHHQIMARLTSTAAAPPSPWASRLLAVALLAVALVAVVIGVFLGLHRLSPSPATHGPSPAPTVRTPGPTIGLVGPNGAAVVQGALLNPGTYTDLEVDGTNFNVRFTVPAGWTWNGRYLSKGGVGLPDGAAIFFDGNLVQVYTDPCHWAGAAPVPPTGSSVRDLVAALAAQPMRSATKPTDRNANGLGASGRWAGMAVELTVPDNIVFANCDRGQVRSWGPDDDARSHQGPGQRDLVWAVDLSGNGVDAGGQRLIIDAASFRGTPANVTSEINAILGSIVVGHWG